MAVEAKEEKKVIARQIVFAWLLSFVPYIREPVKVAILTRNLEVKEYGVFSLIMVTVSVLGYILTLGLDNFIVRTLPGRKEKAQARIFKSILLFVLVFGGILLLISSPLIARVDKFKVYSSTIYLTSVIVFVTLCFSLLSAYYYARCEIYFYKLIILSKNTLWVILLLPCLLLFGMTIQKALLCWFIGLTATVIFSTYKVRFPWASRSSFRKLIVSKGLRYSVPMLPYFFGLLLISVSSRYFLAYYRGVESVAFFAIAYSLVNILFLTVVNIPDIVFPYSISSWNKARGKGQSDENMDSHRKTLRHFALKYSLIFLFPGMIAIWLLREKIVFLLSGESYIVAAGIIPWLILIPLLMLFNRIFEQELMVRNRTKDIGIAYLFGLLVNVVFNFLLVREMGVYGAAAAMLITYFAIFIVLGQKARAFIQIHFKQMDMKKILIANGIFIGVLFGVKHHAGIFIALILSVIVYAVFLFNIINSDFRLFGKTEQLV